MNSSRVSGVDYTCGHCGRLVAASQGCETSGTPIAKIFIRPFCSKPTFLTVDGEQVPGVIYGNAVAELPDDVGSLYDEARRCFSVSAFTSAVLACRKLLMNIAVAQGADEGKRFIEYVDYLADGGYVPPNGRAWVDHIRTRGNEATHEIALKTREDAEELISFVEMLLKFIYEFPAKVPQAQQQPSQGN